MSGYIAARPPHIADKKLIASWALDEKKKGANILWNNLTCISFSLSTVRFGGSLFVKDMECPVVCVPFTVVPASSFFQQQKIVHTNRRFLEIK